MSLKVNVIGHMIKHTDIVQRLVYNVYILIGDERLITYRVLGQAHTDTEGKQTELNLYWDQLSRISLLPTWCRALYADYHLHCNTIRIKF